MAGNPEMENIDTTENSLMICTKCHNHSVVNEGGCLTCRECGWSKCED